MKHLLSTIGCFQRWRCQFLLLFFTLLALILPSGASAQTVVFSDDFAANLEKWQPTRDDGSMWQVVNGAAEVTVSTKNTLTELVPKDSFWNSEWKNITFSYAITPLQGVDRNTSFGWESLQRWFELHFVNGVLNLVRVEDGKVPLNIFEQYPMTNGQTYQVSITVQEQNIKVSVDGELVADTNYQDYIHKGGKIGLKAGTGLSYPTKLRYDNVQVSLNQPTNTQLSVPLFKQTDPLWKNIVYDHAQSWSSQPTIERFGCLISSIAMIMNYHGLTTMNDGSPITPASLNSWLTSQPDGYIGEGLVNWSAVTRLTKKISDAFGTPKLEYSRVQGDGITASITALKNTQPTILELAGHFVASTGFTDDLKDLLINDPAYSYSTLSQHSLPLQSTRLLTPSHTDLSYLVIAHQPELTVSLSNTDGSPIANLETFTELLAADSTQAEETSSVVHQLAKPNTGEFLLTITSQTPKSFKLTVFAYDQYANLTDLSLNGWASSTPQTYLLNYQKETDKHSTLTPQSNWDTLRSSLMELEQAGQLKRKTLVGQLSSVITLAEKEPLSKQLQRVQQLEKLVAAAHNWVTPATQNYLYYLLQLLNQSLSP